MSALIEYFAKLSICLAVVWLFYQFVLRRLTFYNHNRWYLLGYSLLSFVIPFIDITPALHQNDLTGSTVVQWVPLVYNNSGGDSLLSVWNVLSVLVVAGMLFMLVRLMIQLFSFRRMMKKATLVSGDDILLYQVNEPIIPFSFGNAVFFNVNLHTTEELEKIIRHEFVHVKQRHSIDIIFSEILCLLNWYNPFAWLLKAAIRQNLEFVADNKVLENGVNKKQYQYLLLKVIGNNQFSIAQKFNFSSLKKRIAMMNKNKSAKMHLLRFLFLLPVLAFILVSFRKEIQGTFTSKTNGTPATPAAATDTIPDVTERNSKGYVIKVKDNNGECLLIIKDNRGKELKKLLLTEWNADAKKYEAMYGEIPPPPPPAAPSFPGFATENPMPDFLKRNPDVKDVCWKLNENSVPDLIHIMKKDGKTEVYHFNDAAEWQMAEKKYGSLPQPPPPPSAVATAYPEFITTSDNNVDWVEVAVKNGVKEKYDFKIPEQKAAFEKKYGNIPIPPPPPSSPYTLLLDKAPQSPPFPEAPVPVKLPASVQSININNGKATVIYKNGTKENYDLKNADEKAKFEIKYGEFVPAPPVPKSFPKQAASRKEGSGEISTTDPVSPTPASPASSFVPPYFTGQKKPGC